MLLAVMGSVASGQTTGATFDSLVGTLQPGDRVYLTDMTGRDGRPPFAALRALCCKWRSQVRHGSFNPVTFGAFE